MTIEQACYLASWCACAGWKRATRYWSGWLLVLVKEGFLVQAKA